MKLFVNRNNMKEFTGILSGDHECFCFDVSLDEFIRLIGREPDKFEKSTFIKDHYKIYFQDLFPLLSQSLKDGEPHAITKFKISIETELKGYKSQTSEDEHEEWRG